MHHVEHPPHPAGTWQEAASRLAKVTAGHAYKLCKAHGVPPGERDDVAAESLLDLCVSVRSAFARGVEAFDARYFALHGLAASRTRRGRPLQLLADACADPEAALAGRGPGPVEQLEAGEFLPALLARLSDERLRRVVRLRAEGLSTAEVAAREGCCVQRVQQLLQEARLVLIAR